MRWLKDLAFRVTAILSRGKMERELNEEMEFHLEMEMQKYVKSGMTPTEARRQAFKNFGGIDRNKDQARDAWAVGFVQHFRTDVRLGFRQLRVNPLFATAAVLTLALGIGATTAMFSVVHAVLLRPLPFLAPDRLVRLSYTENGQPGRFPTMSYPNIVDWRDRTNVFEGVSILHGWRPTLITDRGPVRLLGASVSAGHFDLLGVRPALGRFFLPGEDIPGHDPVVVLSYSAWQREFAGDEDVLGRSVVLTDLRDEEAGTSYVVVGVAPPDFEEPLFSRSRFELWRSTQAYYTRWNRINHALYALGRIREGLSLADAQRELGVVAKRLEEEYPRENEGKGARLVPVAEIIVGDVRPMLLVLFAGVGLVLVIAAANVASLLLSRAAQRGPEIAVRMALGAGRGRLFAQLMTESLVLAVVGAALGLLLATVGTPSMLVLARDSLPRADAVQIDGNVLTFATFLAFATACIVGVVPALSASPSRLAAALSSTRGMVGSGARSRLRHGLVVVEVAVSLVLLAGAGLLIRSYTNLLAVPAGVITDNVLTFQVSPSPVLQPDERLVGFYRGIEERLAALPGVTAVASGSRLPVNRLGLCTGWKYGFNAPREEPYHDQCVEYRAITASYLDTMGLGLERGRAFTSNETLASSEAQRSGGSSPALLNETAARTYFPGESALGKFVTTGLGTTHEIVGVLRDVQIYGLGEPPVPAIYVPHAGAPGWVQRNMYLFLRTEVDPMSVLPAARSIVWAIDSTAPIVREQTMANVVASDVAAPRFRAVLLTTFASLATTLAAVGIGGLIAFTVAQRTPEIAVRIALGARPGTVVGMVVKHALRLAVVGVAFGLTGAIALSRALSGLLFGLSPVDATTYGTVTSLLVAIVMAASYLSARRAAAVDPARLLNSE